MGARDDMHGEHLAHAFGGRGAGVGGGLAGSHIAPDQYGYEPAADLLIADQLHAGTVSVNTVDALSAMTPFGGMTQSGFGRDLSLHSFDKYTALKTIWIKY